MKNKGWQGVIDGSIFVESKVTLLKEWFEILI